MTHEEIHNAIRSRFKTQVADALPLTTIYDNDPTPAPTDNSIWCRLTVLVGTGRRTTIGTKEYRYPGVATAQLFGPVHSGDKDLLEKADAIIAAFRGVSVGGIRFEGEGGDTVSPQRAGVTNGQYQFNVEIPFVASDQFA